MGVAVSSPQSNVGVLLSIHCRRSFPTRCGLPTDVYPVVTQTAAAQPPRLGSVHSMYRCLRAVITDRQTRTVVAGRVGKKHCRTVLFTARCYASAVLAMALCPSVCLSVCLCLSVTSWSSTKTAKPRITQTTPHDSPGSLVFWCQRSPRNSTGVIPLRGR